MTYLTYLTISQHLYINEWTCEYYSKKRKENSSMLKTNKQLNKGTETQKHKKEPKQRHMTQENKEKEVEKLGLGFLD